MVKVLDYNISIGDTETAWGVDAALNELLLKVRAEVRADLLANKLPATYTVKIERE